MDFWYWFGVYMIVGVLLQSFFFLRRKALVVSLHSWEEGTLTRLAPFLAPSVGRFVVTVLFALVLVFLILIWPLRLHSLVRRGGR